jgi:ectoine hydroxylase-related dioxygenase (phytanoyl-CoA dioxygenase family)
MLRVYEAVILAHHDFGKTVMSEFYDSEAKAYAAMQENLNGFRTSEPEWERSYEGYVYSHKVR